MSRQQLFFLFLCSLIPWTLGNGLLPLLPVYASQLGATPALVGYYLAIAYFALALGTMIAGWLSDTFQRRRLLLILSGAANVPLIWLCGRVTEAWQLTVVTSLMWFMGGMGLTLIAVLAGLGAAEHERGRVFGLLGLTNALGALIGGLSTGAIVDHWGYPALFTTLSIFAVLLPLFGLLIQEPPNITTDSSSGRQASAGFGGRLYLVLLATFMSGIILFVGRLGTSLAMVQLKLSSGDVASTTTIGGLVALPLAPASGWLADRFNRRVLLVISYVVETGGMLVLVGAGTLGAFWQATALLAAAGAVSTGLAAALVTDLVAREKLGRGLSLLNTMTWIGGITGFGLSGAAIQMFGMTPVFIVGAVLAALAVVPVALARPQPAVTRPAVL